MLIGNRVANLEAVAVQRMLKSSRGLPRGALDAPRGGFAEEQLRTGRPRSPLGAGALDMCSSIHFFMSDLRVDPMPKYSEKWLVVVSSMVCPERLAETKSFSTRRRTSS